MLEADTLWEYKTFVYRNWTQNDSWSSLTDQDSYLAPQARLCFWRSASHKISLELEEWQRQGWEAVQEIGPAAIIVCRYAAQDDPSVDVADLLLWFLTLGMALLFEWLNGWPSRQYVTYKPVEFRVRMRRQRQQLIPLGVWRTCEPEPSVTVIPQ